MKIEISREELSKRKLFIAMPCYGMMMNAITAKCLLDLQAVCNSYGVESKVSLLGNESLIQRARTLIAAI